MSAQFFIQNTLSIQYYRISLVFKLIGGVFCEIDKSSLPKMKCAAQITIFAVCWLGTGEVA